jgi:hypothetical protein
MSNLTSKAQAFGLKAYRVAKIAVVVIVVLFALLGAYTTSQTTLRNTVIDYAQNEHQGLK